MVGISPCFVCREQYWLVYHGVLSVMDNIGWYISKFFLSWTILVGKSTIFSVMNNIGLYNNRVFCVVDNNIQLLTIEAVDMM